MTEQYKGCTIYTSWNRKTTGFDFRVRNQEGVEVFCSEKLYFYEENALKAARKVVDEIMGPGENTDEHSR